LVSIPTSGFLFPRRRSDVGLNKSCRARIYALSFRASSVITKPRVTNMVGFLAAGGLVFSFEHCTVAGKAVLFLLCIGSIFSWSVMITKMRVIQFARKQ